MLCFFPFFFCLLIYTFIFKKNKPLIYLQIFLPRFIPLGRKKLPSASYTHSLVSDFSTQIIVAEDQKRSSSKSWDFIDQHNSLLLLLCFSYMLELQLISDKSQSLIAMTFNFSVD